jgi:hypothetical protein
MKSKRNAFCLLMLVSVLGMGSTAFAQPVFENNTPTGFSPADSTRQSRFVTDTDVNVLVDLNESANATYPVIGNFQKIEQSVPFFTAAETAGYMSQAIEIDDSGVVHRAWIQRRGIVDFGNVFSSPAYGVVYAKSFDGGKTFTDTVSVSGTMRFDMITPSSTMANGFSTVDLVVDSKGNPRVTYAMDFSADDCFDGGHSINFNAALTDAPFASDQLCAQSTGATFRRAFNSVFFNYSNDGGGSWLPSNGAVTVNDTSTIGGQFADATSHQWSGRKTAFPRMAITSTDDIFITYQRGMHIPTTADIMLAKLDADSLRLGSAQPLRIGSLGTAGSLGGVRIDPDAVRGNSPDIAIGDDDVIHIVWYNSLPFAAGDGEQIEHKSVPAADWSEIGVTGWNQDVALGGATVGTFESTRATNMGLRGSTDDMIIPLSDNMTHLFPTIVIDRERTPDRIYVLWKHTDADNANNFAADENIRYNTYDYDGQVGANAGWGTVAEVFSVGGSTIDMWHSRSGAGMFQNATRYQIEDNWAYVDRVAAVVDNRIPGVRGDLHIVFSAGPSAGSITAGVGGVGLWPNELANSLYYSRFNGAEWELPQVVATRRSELEVVVPDATPGDGVLSRHDNLFGPDLAMRPGDDNVYMTFVGGSSRSFNTVAAGRVGATGQRGIVKAVNVATLYRSTKRTPGNGYQSLKVGSIAPSAYFKVIGRVTTFEDQSVPVGANQYLLTYNPVNPQTAVTNNLIAITVADNQSGTGIGGATPGASAAPGGFLTGQWQNISATSLGVTSLNPGEPRAIFKGANNLNQSTNNNGVFEGQVNDSGSYGYGEWGDDGDKTGLLVKLNVLGSDSSTNIRTIGTSSASRGCPTSPCGSVPDSSTQSLTINLPSDAPANALGNHLNGHTFVKPIRRAFYGGLLGRVLAVAAVSTGSPAASTELLQVAPVGSYFMIGAGIDIVAANAAPNVSVVSPDASSISSGAFANETFSIQYTLFDSDDNSTDVDSDTLRAALYAYPANGLASVQDIKTFATLIVDERDITSATTRGATDPAATDDFAEGSSVSNTQTYFWDDPGTTYQTAFGWAPVTKTLDGTYYIYIIADDGINPARYAVSGGAMRVRHIPIVRSVTPVAADTVDTGEFSNLAKANPYKIKFTVDDFDDNGQMRLFFSTVSGLSPASLSLTGTYPNQVISLAGATEIQLSDSLRTDEDVQFDFDVTAQGSARDSIIVQGDYYIYAVAADEDTFSLGSSSSSLAIRHSPSFEFTSPLKGMTLKLDVSQQDRYTVEWQRGRSDQDLDGNAIISLYYTGVDPKTIDYSGTDSSRLVATVGTNPGRAVLLAGNIREDDEGGNDQFVWSFRNPPSALPKMFRPKPVHTNDGAETANTQVYQVGSMIDTAWVYAVLHDSLGNTRVQAGGSVLFRSGDVESYQATPRVVMRTPPAGGQTMINGDILRLEWDAFLIDDGTGTDDAYLRLYAAPKGKYSTITSLESNASGRGGNQDVYIINSLTGGVSGATNTDEAYDSRVTVLRESEDSFLLWDTKTTSFQITGTPTEFDIFIAGSTDRRFGDPVYTTTANGVLIDSIASGLGSQAQKAVLSKAPGALRVEGADPIYSVELAPGTMAASTGDTLEMDVFVNSQNSSIDLMAFHLDIPRNYFEVIDMDAGTAGLQPFADSTGAFKTPSTVAQNDTTQGTERHIKINFVESIVNGEVIGSSTGDSSQVAARIKLLVKRFAGGAPFDTLLSWSLDAGRRTAFRRGRVELAAPAREVFITLTPNARVIATVPLEGRSDYSDTLDVHFRMIGSTNDITDQNYVKANDITPDTTSSVTTVTLNNVVGTFVAAETITGPTSAATASVSSVSGSDLIVSSVTGVFSDGETVTGGTSAAIGNYVSTSVSSVALGDSVQVLTNSFGTFTLTEIPVGIYEMTVKADGYISGRTDTLTVFNGLTLTPDPTFGSDVLGNLSPATALGALRGGDATGDNQVDIADANLVYSLWNQTRADAGYVRGSDINSDGVINSLDLGFVTSNFGNDGYGAPPVFKPTGKGGDNATAQVGIEGVEDVEAWWPGRVFEVTAKAKGMSDVMAYELVLGFDPEKVKLLPSQAVVEGNVFANNSRGALFFSNAEPGRVEVASGRIGRDWSASGDAELVTVRFMALSDDPGEIEILGGQLVNSAYLGTVMRVEKAQALPLAVALHQNFPNPFNPSTEIHFDIPTARNVELRIYNQLGQTVRTLVDNRMKAGSYRLKWDGRTEAGHSVSSGVYFYSLEAGDFSQIRKMTLVK